MCHTSGGRISVRQSRKLAAKTTEFLAKFTRESFVVRLAATRTQSAAQSTNFLQQKTDGVCLCDSQRASCRNPNNKGLFGLGLLQPQSLNGRVWSCRVPPGGLVECWCAARGRVRSSLVCGLLLWRLGLGQGDVSVQLGMNLLWLCFEALVSLLGAATARRVRRPSSGCVASTGPLLSPGGCVLRPVAPETRGCKQHGPTERLRQVLEETEACECNAWPWLRVFLPRLNGIRARHPSGAIEKCFIKKIVKNKQTNKQLGVRRARATFFFLCA